MMLVILHGSLRRFGKRFRLDVKTPAEAIRALGTVLPGFRQHLRKHSEPGYHILVGKQDIEGTDLSLPSSEKTIRIIPHVAGANNPWVRVVIGAILIYASWGAGTAGVTGWWGSYVGAAQFIGGIGTAMAISGASQIIAGSPKAPGPQEAANNRPSFAFDGAVNTIGQGHPVPVLYGRMIVGSAVISSGLAAEAI